MAKTQKPVQWEPHNIKEQLLEKYPPKVARKRAGQIIINEALSNTTPEIVANVRTIPGIITMRGCTYAGCKGVIMGPASDIVNLVHGPVGCSFYAWLTRRNQTDAINDTNANYIPYAMTTDMQDSDVIFGGEKKLAAAIQEAYDLFHPKAIAIFATCPVGLIGDDIHAVAKRMKEQFGDCNVFAFSCEGYKGVSQSAGHHIANNKVFTDVVGQLENTKDGEFRLNILGEYNIGGDAFEIERITDLCGFTVHSTFSGNSEYDDFASAHTVDLNVVMCHRSINYMAEMMEKRYGIPWFKISFIGAEATAKSLRKIAAYFGSPELMEKVEKVIAEEMVQVEVVRQEVKARCEGKTAMLFLGGSRAHHYQDLFTEIGMKTVSAGYEFAHRDDYEGRKVIPNIVVDADTRNIEELTVEADPTRYRARKTEEELTELSKQTGIGFNEYLGMMVEMKRGDLIIDDLNHHEAEILMEKYKPDIFCAGIKEKYVIQKGGVPLKQLHSYDYSGPYAGFQGAINFYREIDRMVNSNVFRFIKAPWQKNPELSGSYAWNR